MLVASNPITAIETVKAPNESKLWSDNITKGDLSTDLLDDTISSDTLNWLTCGIRTQIRQQLNPHHQGGTKGKGDAADSRRVRVETMITPRDFLTLFPNSQKYERKKKNKSKVPDCVRHPKFLKTKRLYYQKISNLRDLDGLFGNGWDIVFNRHDVGFALPPFNITLVETTVHSFKNQLARDDERFNVTYSNKEKYQSLKLSFSRSSRSRWSKDGKGESDWEKQTKMLQNQQQDVPPQENM